VIYSFVKGGKIKIGKEMIMVSVMMTIPFYGKSQTQNLTRSVGRPDPSPKERGAFISENSPLHGRGAGATDASGEALSLQSCLKKALENNPNLKISNLEITQNQALTKSARDLGKTTFDVQYGRTQVFTGNDITMSVGQNFALPSLYKAQENLLKGNVLTAEKRANLSKNQLIGEVKSVYFLLLNNGELIKLLTRQDSLYQAAFRAASVRYKVGETNLLEKISFEARLKEIQNRIQGLKSDEKALYQNLKFLINTSEDFLIEDELLFQKILIINELNTLSNPFLSILKQQNEVNILQTNLEKERLKPDFRVGLINQSIEQNYNQNIVQVGVNVPIFTKAQQARIESSKIGQEIGKQQIQLAENQLESQLKTLKIQHDKVKNSIGYYEKSALPQANLIISTATKTYQSGEIEYVEFVQNITQAWQIKESYLSEIQTLNQIIINIETIIGNENSY
jgi:heavy metal efflux system protein